MNSYIVVNSFPVLNFSQYMNFVPAICHLSGSNYSATKNKLPDVDYIKSTVVNPSMIYLDS